MNEIQLPDLEPGRTYGREEVEQYIALQGVADPHQSDDYTTGTGSFPHSNTAVGEMDPLMYRPDGVKVIEYHEYPIERFAGWLGHRRSNPKQDDERRVAAIKTVLNGGAPAFPVWIEKHQVDLDPLPVREGHHRLLAFAELGLPLVPVFLVKYDDEQGLGDNCS